MTREMQKAKGGRGVASASSAVVCRAICKAKKDEFDLPIKKIKKIKKIHAPCSAPPPARTFMHHRSFGGALVQTSTRRGHAEAAQRRWAFSRQHRCSRKTATKQYPPPGVFPSTDERDAHSSASGVARTLAVACAATSFCAGC